MFQNQQKGLFTFYREQQLFQEEIKKKKQRQLEKHVQNKKKDKKEPKQVTPRNTYGTQKVISQPAMSEQIAIEHQPPPTKFKRFGDAVIVFKRKTTQHINPLVKAQKQSPPPKEELGSYVQNKKIEFQSPEKEEQVPVSTHRKKNQMKRKQILRSSHSKPRANNYTRLPSIAKVDPQEELRSPSQLKNKINGSLLKANGSQLLRQIRSRAVVEDNLTQQQRSVSYFEFSRDYRKEPEGKKKGNLSMQQKKLLQILGRYRRYDH